MMLIGFMRLRGRHLHGVRHYVRLGFLELLIPQILRGCSLMLCMVPINNLSLGTLPPEQIEERVGTFQSDAQPRRRGRPGDDQHAPQQSSRLCIWRVCTSSVAWGHPVAEDQLASMQQNFSHAMPDGDMAALKQLAMLVRQQANVLSFADLFLVLTILFAIAGALHPTDAQADARTRRRRRPLTSLHGPFGKRQARHSLCFMKLRLFDPLRSAAICRIATTRQRCSNARELHVSIAIPKLGRLTNMAQPNGNARKKCSCCRAAEPSVPTRAAPTKHSPLPALNPNGSRAFRSAPSTAAIIAGNPRRETCRNGCAQFWDLVSSRLTLPPLAFDDTSRKLFNETSAALVASTGAPGFFEPRYPPALVMPPGTVRRSASTTPSPLQDDAARTRRLRSC